MMVGGFATAVRLRLAELLPEPAAVAAVAAAEAGIIEHVNADHADAVSAIAEGLLGQAPAGIGEAWHLAAVDVDGADLAVGERVCRLHFLRPVASAEAIRAELVRAARGGRQGDSANQHSYDPTVKEAWPGMIPRLGSP